MDNEENINQFLAKCDEKYDIANVDIYMILLMSPFDPYK